jgi:hypothetical protein
MDKKELKFYVAPEMETFNLEPEGQLLSESLPDTTTIVTDDDDWADDEG